MTGEEKIQRFNILKVIEENLKAKRDFSSLIRVLDESMKLFDSIENNVERLQQKAYCYARIGKVQEAKETLEVLSNSSFFLDKDELYRAATLISFFMTNEATQLSLVQLNTIKSWMQEPYASRQILSIVFDYQDFIRDIQPFDTNKLIKKQTYFFDELIDCVFASMESNDDIRLFYNKDQNIVQQKVEDYFTNSLAKDRVEENRRLANRIMSSEPRDSIVNGIHYLIPKLKLIYFLEVFSKNASEYDNLLLFLKEVEENLTRKFKRYLESNEDLTLNGIVSESFYHQLDKWYKENDFDLNELKKLLSTTQREIALGFLEEVNE